VSFEECRSIFLFEDIPFAIRVNLTHCSEYAKGKNEKASVEGKKAKGKNEKAKKETN